jgi:hypothetical protein
MLSDNFNAIGNLCYANDHVVMVLFCIEKCLINSVELSPSREASTCPATKEISIEPKGALPCS